MKYQAALFCILIACIAAPVIANAEVQIASSKKTYNYGDYLGIVISVSEVTGDDAIMHIIDSDGVRSSAIPVQIKNTVTAITSPSSFDAAIFKEGKYHLEIEYAGQKGTAEFELVDAGNITLPLASSVIVSEWAHSTISDHIFLKFLADNDVISLQKDSTLEKAKIPSWYKTNGIWWTEKRISDVEFVNGLQYLLDKKIIS